ncbi:MAG: hypothetical protein D6806_11380 [Deltaproteobacteria bacterium]|nr:MAG: hypothetical protein D6806_11380 [Deltaproteobacteria bacterium]
MAPREPGAGVECPFATLGDGGLTPDVLGLDDFQERMKQLAQKARLLATQVAIAAEGGRGGLSSVDTDCRLLAQGLEQAAESFTQKTGDFAVFVRSLGSQAAVCNRSVESLRNGISAFRDLLDRGSALLGRLAERTDALVATGSGLGSSYRELAGQFHRRQQWTERIREQLASIGSVSAATAEAAGKVASMVADTFGEDVPASASVARQLLQSHQALRNAVEQLERLAETNRIDLVTPEAEEVLESIHRAADAARRSLAGEAEKG